MKQIELPLPGGIEASTLVKLIDTSIQAAGLTTAMRNTLRKYPGCIHWHIANGSQAGTLELTFWPKEERAWFTIQDGRRAEWIAGKMEEIGDILQNRIGRQFGRR